MSDLPTYVLERVFDAPRQLVWKTWTDPVLLARWYGPNVETIIHRLDVTPGGLWLNEMKWGENSMYQRAEYTDVVEPERIVCLMSSTNANWEVATNPKMPDWPRVLLTTVVFDETDGKTTMRLTWQPYRRTLLRLPALQPQSTAWAKVGARVWNCWPSCWLNCKLEWRRNASAVRAAAA